MSEEHEAPHVNYFIIFLALCVFTLLSFAADLMKNDLGKVVLASLVMGIACFKASFVLLYFMHIRFEGPWKYVLLAPTTVLAMAIPFALAPDISYHYYMVDTPQIEAPAATPRAGHGHGEHGESGEGETPHAESSATGHSHGTPPAKKPAPKPGH